MVWASGAEVQKKSLAHGARQFFVANGGVTNRPTGFKGCLAALPALLLPFSPFCGGPGPKSTWEIQKTEEKGTFPQTFSDLLKPPSLKPNPVRLFFRKVKFRFKIVRIWAFGAQPFENN